MAKFTSKWLNSRAKWLNSRVFGPKSRVFGPQDRHVGPQDRHVGPRDRHVGCDPEIDMSDVHILVTLFSHLSDGRAHDGFFPFF